MKQEGFAMVMPDWVHGLCLFAVVGWLLDATVAVGIERFNTLVDRRCTEIEKRLREKHC